jgi:large subunit ribosomal protein L24e
MPIAHSCSFCNSEISPGKGMMFIKTDGTILWFCSSKCRKNMLKLNRDKKKFKWTRAK